MTKTLYEQEPLRRVVGEAIRPGGLTLTKRALAWCGFREGSRILDAGCGVGITVHRLRSDLRLRASGLDVSMQLLREGRRLRPDAPLLRASALRVPFGNATHDGIFCECVLSLLEDPVGALKEFQRVLKPEGLLVITDIYARCPEQTPKLAALPYRSCLKGAVSRTEMLRRLETAGFGVELWEEHSRALKELAARIVLAHGSLERFWEILDPDTPAGGGMQCAVACAKPGYCLLIARKDKERQAPHDG